MSIDIILRSETFTDDEIKRLNYCRMYLQAHALSDLTELGGFALDSTKLKGSPSIQSSVTCTEQINQQRPSDDEGKLWCQANRLWSKEDDTLCQPLGPWTVPIKQQRQRHAAYWTTSMLWVRQGDTYIICYPTGCS